jgi:hypothetical protein
MTHRPVLFALTALALAASATARAGQPSWQGPMWLPSAFVEQEQRFLDRRNREAAAPGQDYSYVGRVQLHLGVGALELPVQRLADAPEITRRQGDGELIGFAWTQPLGADRSLTVSSWRRDNLRPDVRLPRDNETALRWQEGFSLPFQPRLTGGLLLGNDVTEDTQHRSSTRRYLGFEVGGSLTLADTHTPFAMLRVEQNDYLAPDAATAPAASLSVPPARDYASSVTAGWRWQALPSWNVSAEARYRMNEVPVDPALPERTRLQLRTRFDFR